MVLDLSFTMTHVLPLRLAWLLSTVLNTIYTTIESRRISMENEINSDRLRKKKKRILYCIVTPLYIEYAVEM